MSSSASFQRARAVGRQRLGQDSERYAVAALTAAGYVIEARNVRYPVGEIDIVAREGRTLCFIEVRATSSTAWGGPLASITDRKRCRIIRAATWYLQAHPTHLPEMRFDVIGLVWENREQPTVELVRGAFWAP